MRFAILASLMLVIGTAQAVDVGASLVDLPLPLRDGASTVAAYEGKVLYLDVWATWCGPCHKSLPWMEQMHQRYADQGLAVVAVSIDQKATDLDNYLSRMHLGIGIGHDPKAGIAKTLAVEAMPTAVLIDRQGVVQYVHKGFHAKDGAELETRIQQLLAVKGE